MSKQKNIFSEKKVRYKMYKAGKSWVIAGMASASFLTINLLQSHDELVARADVTSESSSSKYNFNDKTIVLHNQNSVDVNSESKATNSGNDVNSESKATSSGNDVNSESKATSSGNDVNSESKATSSGNDVNSESKATSSGNDVNSESKATSSGNDVNSESKATSSGNDVNPESKATSSGNDVNSESKATSSGNDINSEPKATNDSENNKVAEKAEYNGKANTSSATNGDKKKVSKVQLSKKELYSSGNALLRNETGLKNDNEKSPVTTMSGEKIAKQIVARIYADTKKKVASSLVNSTLLAVSSDPDIERESFNDVVNNGKDESPTSVHVALADQVANKDKYYAEAKTNGTLAEVGTWEKFVEAYNNQNITYIKLTQDMSSGISSRNSNNSGSGNPLSPRTNGIIVDGDNHTLDLGLDVSMFVGTAPTGTQFTLTDVKLMQEHSQGSASSGSTRSVIQTPYSNRRENDGLWTFNINNVEYVGAASLTENKGGKYGYPPARLVDMEDSLVNYSGNIKWYSDQELSTNGSVHIADGAKIEYAQTYQNSDMDSVFYFMSWDHVNTVNDTGAAHDIQIGDGAFLDVKATQRNTSADRTVFYNSWTDMNVGNKVTWKQDGFTQLFNSDSDSSIYGGNGDSYSASNRFFTTLIGHDLNHRSIKFGQELDMEVPLVRDRAFYLDRNWSVYFAAATTLKVNLDRSNAAIYLRNGAQLTFISPRKLTIQNNNGKATNTDLFDISGNENGVYSTFSLNNSTINYWNRSAVTSTPTGSLTFQTLQANSRGFQAKDYAGNSLDVGTNSTLGSQTNAFTTLANEPGKIKIRYVNQDNVEVGTTEVPIDNNDYIGKIISLRKPLYVTTNMPNNYMWAIGNQVYSGAVDDKQSGGDITSTTDDGDSYGQATYAIVPAEEARRDNTYTVYVYGVPETVNYQYVDARTGKVLSSDGLNAGQEHVGNLSPANFGNVIEWKNSYYTQKNVPLGYHYATTTDELNGQVQPDKLTVGSENPVTTIYVAGDDASAKITFVDTQSGASLPDSSITLTGYVGQAPTSGNEFLLPKNYKLDPTTQPNQAAFTSKVNNDGSTTITYTQELTLSNNDIQINLVHDTTEATETKSIKRTIKFVDINNQSVSPNVVQTVNFVRTVTTDKVNGAVQYGEWLAEAGTSFPSFSSPDVTGMFPDVQTVSEQAGITPESNDSEIVVHYYSKVQTVEPTDPKDPGTPVDPNNPDGPKWPDGVDKDSLNQTATRTIHYVDADGNKLADDVVQTVKLSRSATVDFSDPAKPTVTYGAWEAADSFASVTSPTVKGYVTTQGSVGEETPTAPTSSSETVKYITGGQTVEPTDPKDPGTPVDPNNPDGPKWPDGVDKDSLNQTATRTIHYVDADGKQVADDVVQTVKLSRSATVDFSDPAKPTVTYGAWEAADSFASVTSPTVKGYVTTQGSVGEETPTAPTSSSETVKYITGGQTVEPTDPKDPGTPVDPNNPDGPKWPDGVDKDSLNQTATRTIHYVDADGNKLADDVVQTVKLSRSATVDFSDPAKPTVTYGAWNAAESYGSQTSPTVAGYVTSETAVADATPTTPETIETTVKYVKSGQTVTPDDPKDPNTPVDPNNPDGPKWPDGVDKDSLNQTATRTIHYVDADGNKLADDVVQTVKLSRSATVDFSDPAKPTVTYGAWEAADSFASVTSPTIKGYVTTQGSVGEETPTAPTSSSETVKYITGGQTVEPTDPKDPGTPVDPNNPDGPKWPDGVDKDSLNQTATRTIHYVDADGNKLADDVVQTVKLSRSATVDFSDPAKPTVTYGAWEAADSFASVTSPTIKGYVTTQGSVGEETPTAPTSSSETVKYITGGQTVEPTDPKDPGTPVDPNNPDGPKWPDGVDKDSLNQTATRTIHYVDADGNKLADDVVQTVKLSRSATVDFSDPAKPTVTYGAWEAADSFASVTSPTIKGYVTTQGSVGEETPTAPTSSSETVKYITGGQTVEPTDPKDPGTPVDPNNPDGPKWPDGVDKDSLNQTATRTIHYVDADGNKLADDVVQTVKLSRSATVDFSDPAKPTVTYGAWEAADSFASVTSPTIKGYVTTQGSVGEETPTAPTSSSETVKYITGGQTVEPTDPKDPGTPVDPNNPDGPKWPDGVDKDSLNQTATRTIHYVDADGNKLADDVVQTVKLSRSATVDFSDPAKPTVTYGAWEAAASFASVTSPTVKGYVTTQGSVGEETPTVPTSSSETVKYITGGQTVEPTDPKDPGTPVDPNNPDGPKWPDGVDKDSLNQTATRTIHYVDADGKQVADDVVQTVKLSRSATVDFSDPAKPTVTYGAWEAADSFASVTSPTVKGYVTTQGSVGEETPTAPTSSSETVKYITGGQTVEPTDPKDPGTPVDPNNPDGPKWPDGVDKDSLNQTATRTIHYVDADGKQVADDVVQTVKLSRSATVDFSDPAKPTVTYGAWNAAGSYGSQTSPTVAGYVTSETAVADATPTTPETIETTVKYVKSGQTVTPDDPKDPNTPVDPNNPDGPKWPDGVDKDSLNQTATRTIHYVDADGKQVADDVVQTVKLSRSATVDFSDPAKPTVTYGAWEAADSFASVTSPTVKGYVTTQGSVGEETPTAPTSSSETVKYITGGQTVEPTDPKDPGTPVDPNNPDGPKWPDGVDKDSLNQTATRTIHYVDADGNKLADDVVQTVKLSRSATVDFSDPAKPTVTYGAWNAAESYGSQTSPTVAGYVTSETAVADATPTTPETIETTVKYVKSGQTVTPDDPKDPNTPVDPNNPDGPKWPDGVDKDSLNQTATRTIHYVDADGKQVADDVVQTVKLSRSATVDFSDPAKPTVTYGAWEAADSFASVTSPTIKGYVTTQGSVGEETPTAPTSSSETVKYITGGQTVEPTDPKDPGTPVDPNNPDGPKWPDGVDKDSLNQTATRTIHYVDADGNKLADDVVQTVKLSRSATVDFSDPAKPTVTYGAWEAADSFASVTSPTIKGYVTTQGSVGEETPTAPTSSSETVKYITGGQTVEPTDPKDPGTPVDPNNPDGPKWPDGVDKDSLNQTATRTIHYVDADGNKLADDVVQTVKLSRSATVDFSDPAKPTVTYGAWEAADSFASVTSPTVKGYVTTQGSVGEETPTAPTSSSETVKYITGGQTVEPTDPKDPGTPVDPNNPDGPKWPDGVDKDSLNQTATRTIHYVDADGKQVADDVVQTVKLSRSATVDFSDPAKPTVTYGAWEAAASFASVTSPTVKGYVTTQGSVGEETPTAPTSSSETVKYITGGQTVEPTDPKDPGTPVDPNNPDGPKWPDGVDKDSLNQTATRTIHYVDADGNKLADDVVQTVKLSRSATIDFSDPAKPTVTYGAWEAAASFASVTSPTVKGYVTTQGSVGEETPTTPTSSSETVKYITGGQTVEPTDPKDPGTPVDPNNPDGPKWPDGVDKDSLNQTATRTIHYVDADGNKLADDVVQTVKLSRSATVDFSDPAKPTVTYGAWEAAASFASVTSPTVKGYVTTQGSVGEETPTAPTSSSETVKYITGGQTVEPTDPKDPGTPVDPNNPDGPKWPDGVDKDSLNQTATRTIHYVDADGNKLADDVVQTVKLSRSATVDFSDPAKPTVTYGAWEAAASFASVTSPTIKGYVTTQGSVGEETPTAPTSSSETVKYITGGQTVEPTDPKDPGTPVDPNNPDGPKWPDGVDKDSLNQTATRTIHYVDADGNKLADDVVQTVKLSRSATVDFSDPAKPTVTYGAWNATGSYESVISPEVSGYTTNQKLVESATPGSPESATVSVIYSVNKVTMPKAPKELKQYGSVKKGTAIYAVKHIYMYKDMTFKRSSRIISYVRQPRINRPMFIVKRIVKLANGKVLYQVKDVNHRSKSAGKVGYITVNANYVKPVYYQSVPSKITVINSKGVNGYKLKGLKGKSMHYKQGQVLKVKGIVKHNSTTRYILSNGQYITANKKLVKWNKQKFAKTIKATHGINLYRDVNLQKRVAKVHIKKGVKLNVKELEYSRASDFTTFGAKRYYVKGGYVTGNTDFVKVVKMK